MEKYKPLNRPAGNWKPETGNVVFLRVLCVLCGERFY
jgi:hypothetical protein